MWLGIGGLKYRFYTTSLQNIIYERKYFWKFFFFFLHWFFRSNYLIRISSMFFSLCISRLLLFSYSYFNYFLFFPTCRFEFSPIQWFHHCLIFPFSFPPPPPLWFYWHFIPSFFFLENSTIWSSFFSNRRNYKIHIVDKWCGPPFH